MYNKSLKYTPICIDLYKITIYIIIYTKTIFISYMFTEKGLDI